MKFNFFFIFFIFSLLTFSQEKQIKAYLDCRCEDNYLKQNTSFLEYVRDQDLADIEIFILDVYTPTGSRSFEINIDGNNSYQGINSSMKVVGFSNDTSSTLRDKLLEKLKLALVPFLDKGGYNLNVNIDNQFEDLTINDEKWKNWVFELSGSYNNDKEESRKTNRYQVEFEIDKLTPEWRIGIELSRNESNRNFYSENNIYKSNRKTTSLRARVVRSISNNFSAGVFLGGFQNTYENVNFQRYFMPAIEYSLFPYEDVLSKEVTLAYRIGTGKRNYIEKTIYGYTEQVVFPHGLTLNVKFRKKWGNISSNIRGDQFLNDGTKKRLTLRSNIDIRLFEGLAVRFSSNISLIRDQYNLAANSSSTIEDLLLQQRQIATDYKTDFSIGLSYTFGSIYNSVINTRL
ncbi:MAG: hypothetical protein VXX96_01260 [Bacteroidota bacterium]|nr:hypothetical protein [Bacteroidota bacterium]MEC8601809.1 hypothetical protein [Bacteroidota bacterium]